MSRGAGNAGGPESGAAERPAHFVQSLERGLAVIKAFDHTRPQLTAAEVAKITGMDRAAARRFLLTLVELGYMVTDGRVYTLRPRVLELGYAYLSSLSLPEVALPHMEELVAEVHETCSMAVLDGDEVVFVARVPTRRLVAVPIMVGSRFPAYPTSTGRVLLAGQSDSWLDRYVDRTPLAAITDRTVTDPAKLRSILARVRTRGWVIVDQEADDGSRSVAMPIRDSAGHVIAALNISTLATRGSAQTLREFIPVMTDAIGKIEADLPPGLPARMTGLTG